jgi:predicted O-methyltransferase YrrM
MTATIWDDIDPELNVRLGELANEGRAIFHRFDLEVRRRVFHPFVPSDYDTVLRALLAVREPGLRFLEWGSGTGVITIMADLLGFEACGIEIDEELVEVARELARRFGSGATFAAGSLLPAGYVFRRADGDTRLGTIAAGRSGYDELGLGLEDFDLIFGYAWPGEKELMLDLARRHARADARLLLNEGTDGVVTYVGGRPVGGDGPADPSPG